CFSKLVEFSGSEQDLLCALANQISIAIDWTRTFESLKERNFRGEVLREMIHDISSDDDLEENMRIILEKTILALKGEVGYVSLLTNYSEKINHEIVFGMRKQNVPELRIGETGITAIVYLSKKLYSWPKCYIIDELHEPYISLNDRIKSELIAPLLYNKRVIGFITIGKNEESGFKKSDEIFIQSVADNSALIIQKKQFQIATKALSELRFPEMDKGSICNTLAAKAAEIMGSPVSWVRLIDSESEDRTLHIHGWYGKGLSDVGKIKDPETLKHLESEQSVSWGAIQKAEEILSSTSKEGDDEILTLEKLGEDIISLDITQASNVPGRCKPFLERNELCSMLTMPMISGNNVIGVVNVYARRRYGFYDEEKLLLFNLAKSGAIALKKAELMEHTVFLKSEIERFGTTSNIGIAALGFVHDAGIAMHKVNMLISATVDIIPNEIVKVGMGKTITDDLISESTKLRTVFKSLINYGYSKDIIFRSVKIFEVINVAKRMMEIRLKERNINCFIKFGKGANKKLKIDCDKDQLFHVFINLFNNAIESLDKSKTERKNIVIKISDRDRGNINIHFEDNGIGILKEDKKKVFKLHYSTKKHGTGYGLTICKNVIEDFHDGEISVESNPIKSKTTFTIVLPKKQKLKKRKRNDIEITT
nr:GAF domain-containing sensor histidine kinase [bacterium]